MQIKTRLTLLFTILVAALLLVFACTIYFISAKTREEEYFGRLKQQATTKAHLLFDTRIAPSVLQLIYKKSPNILSQEEVAIYDSTFHLLYHDAVDVDKVKETQGMIDSILNSGEIRFYQGRTQVVGFAYPRNSQRYVITAAAMDEYGFSKLFYLRNTLIIVFLIAIVLIFFVGRFLASQSLRPVAVLIDSVKRITATSLDLRVSEGNRKDEMAALAITFNEMLHRLEASFDAQKAFVSNISHELRTPLTAMLTELQLTASKPRTAEEYQRAIEHITGDTQKLVRLSNSLLDLAKASYDLREISFKEVRIDEVLLDARNDILHHQPAYRITIAFSDEGEQEDFLTIKGNAYLLRVAFINLMENGCKFSDNRSCSVTIGSIPGNIILQFSDEGIGIPEVELPNIFQSFYRGSNKSFTEGNGIGLSLTQKIVALHRGSIAVSSIVGKGSYFTLTLPKGRPLL